MPEPRMLLWLDVEATGLLTDATPPTMLEAAWTITDTAGYQRSPFRQAFTALPLVPGQDKLHTPEIGNNTSGDPIGVWMSANYPSLHVQEMHGHLPYGDPYQPGSRLALEWALLDDSPRRTRILRDWAELQRLILDDLDHAEWHTLERGQVLLAGGGVSHYEDRFARYFMPRIFGDTRVHYSTGADVSTVLRTLSTRTGSVGSTADKLLAAHAGDLRDRVDAADWAEIHLSRDRFDTADTDVNGWVTMERDNHRAAPGIARALMAYRLLPTLLADTPVLAAT